MEFCLTLFIQTSLNVTGEVPGFWTFIVMVLFGMSKVMLVIRTCSVDVKPNVRAPVHAPTARLTATATAMRITVATTGLSAFLLLILIDVHINAYLDI